MGKLKKMVIAAGLGVVALAAQAEPELALWVGHAGGPGVIPVAMASLDLRGNKHVGLVPMEIASQEELIDAVVAHNVDCAVLPLTDFVQANLESDGDVRLISILGRDPSVSGPDGVQTLGCNTRLSDLLPRGAVIATQAAIARAQDKLVRGGEAAARYGVAVAESSADLHVDVGERERLIHALENDGVFIEKKEAIPGGIGVEEMGLLHAETIARWRRNGTTRFAVVR